MKIVFTAGVWDIFHTGHLRMLERSKALAGSDGLLIVGVVTDMGAAAYKPTPPTINEHHRLRIISALECVDAAFLQAGTDPSGVLRSLAKIGCTPDIMTHGDDWSELKEGGETLEELGVELTLLPYTPDVSTTEIRDKIRGVSTTETIERMRA